MALTETTMQEILSEYAARRQQHETERDLRVADIYRQVPEIAAIDEEIQSFGLNAMKGYLQNGRDAARSLSELRSRYEHLTASRAELLRRNGYAPDAMEVHYTCPLCKDTGYVDYQKCSCLKQRIIRAAYDHSGLPNHLKKENRQAFNPALFSDEPYQNEVLTPRQNILNNLNVVEDAVRQIADGGCRNLLFTGTAGTGKSFLSGVMANELLALGRTVLYVGCYDLCAYFDQEHFGDRARKAPTSLSAEAIDACDLLIIDDLGAEFRTSLSYTSLFHLIDQRLQNEKSTVLSTNWWIPDLRELYDERFVSRILGGYTIVRFFGPDLRVTQARAGSSSNR